MENLLSYLAAFVDLGSVVVLPIIMFIFGILLGTKPQKAFVAGITVGIGLIGLNLVIGLLVEGLGTAAQSMVERFGLSLTTLDVGWPASAAISYGTILGSLAIPIGIGVNVVLLTFRLTRTLNVDIWNYRHGAFIGSMIFSLTGDFSLSLFSIVVYTLMIFLMADMLGKTIQKTYGFPNMTFPHGTAAPGFWIGLMLNKIFDKIPGFNKLQADPESIQKRFGILGDNTVIGLVIGVGIGLLAGYDIKNTLNLGVSTAAVMIIMPKMAAILMEGLIPISEAAGKFANKRFEGRELYIGMDAAISVGHPAVLSTSLLLVPIALLLAVVLPGNTTLPFGDLATMPFIICLMVAAFNGNIIRALVGGVIYLVPILYISSWAAPYITAAAKTASFDIGTNSSITSLVDGGIWPTLLYLRTAEFTGWIGMIILAALFMGGLVYVNRIKKDEKI